MVDISYILEELRGVAKSYPYGIGRKNRKKVNSIIQSIERELNTKGNVMNVNEYETQFRLSQKINPDITEAEFRVMYAGAVKAGSVVLPPVQGF